MMIINRTRGVTVSEDAREARSFLSRLRGLMLTKTLQTLVLVNPHPDIEGASIHMWFMRQPLDVIWLNERMKVVTLAESIRPWALRIFRPRASAKYVIECPVGTIKRTGTKEGDSFSFA